MTESDTLIVGLPMALEAARPRPSLVRDQTTAAFVSQLLAARANLAPQRSRRRGTSEGAIGAYAAGAKVAVRRMPVGYRTTIVA